MCYRAVTFDSGLERLGLGAIATREWRNPQMRSVLFAAPPRNTPVVLSRVGKKRVAERSDAIAAALGMLVQTASTEARSERTRRTYTSEVRYFVEFCEVVGLNPEEFGMPEESGGMGPREEELVLALFSCYVVHYPRRGGSAHINTASYAEGCLSAVRAWVSEAYGRRPGPDPAECYTLRQVLRGLHKLSPDGKLAPRLPVLREHLLAIRKLLDLEGSQRDRVLWAFYLTCWQGVCRAGDLILPKRGKRAVWDPARETHLGRLQGKLLADGRRRLELLLKPTKTDPTGEKHFSKTFLTDPDAQAISAGNALVAMLAGRPPVSDRSAQPLFLDPCTGLELTYETAARSLKELLTRAGFAELATGTHSLRIGGATTAAALGGSYLAGCMGLWTSSSMHRYMWGMRDQIEAVACQMATRELGPVAVRPGPVASYACVR